MKQKSSTFVFVAGSSAVILSVGVPVDVDAPREAEAKTHIGVQPQLWLC